MASARVCEDGIGGEARRQSRSDGPRVVTVGGHVVSLRSAPSIGRPNRPSARATGWEDGGVRPPIPTATATARVAVAVALAVAGLAGCGSGSTPAAPDAAVARVDPARAASPRPEAEASRAAVAPAPSAVVLPWVVGASPLPLRADGFGVNLPTPPELRDRRLTSIDTLPRPTGTAFASTVQVLSASVQERMGATWSTLCPVDLAGLRYLTVSFRGFDGAAHTGELVVNATEADKVVSVFREIYAADFPLEQLTLPTGADLTAPPTGDGNVSGAFVCRTARGQRAWSQHAYGLAVDVNPFQNPQVKKGLVLPELAGAYRDRADQRPGMLTSDSVVVRAFARIGWRWGGDWTSSKDYMHFSRNGR